MYSKWDWTIWDSYISPWWYLLTMCDIYPPTKCSHPRIGRLGICDVLPSAERIYTCRRCHVHVRLRIRSKTKLLCYFLGTMSIIMESVTAQVARLIRIVVRISTSCRCI